MSQASPLLFFETLNGYQRTECLKAAIELEVFTAIGEGAVTASAIAGQCRASERGVRSLCDFLTVLGFLTKDDGAYELTTDSATFLDRRSPAYIGGAIGFLTTPMLRDAFAHTAEAVRKGGTALPQQGSITPGNSVWVEFARSMAPMTVMPAERIAKFVGAGAWNVLDIAAGHGTYGITIARHNPGARITAVDWPSVLQVAQENAERAGVADRFAKIPGSAFEVELGNGYDLALLTNLLHHFSARTCETLLRRIHAALKPGGRVATLEFVPNESRVSPPSPAMFSMIMLTTTPDGDAYTFSEYQRMFADAGFSRSEVHELPPSPQSLILTYKG